MVTAIDRGPSNLTQTHLEPRKPFLEHKKTPPPQWAMGWEEINEVGIQNVYYITTHLQMDGICSLQWA